MNSTTRHLGFALLWLLALPAIAVPVAITSDLGAYTPVYAKVASIVWILGFSTIFYSWARNDAPSHGKPQKVALGFAIAWPFLLIFTHIVYLLYTRGTKAGLISVLKFICFLLVAGVFWLGIGQVGGGFT